MSQTETFLKLGIYKKTLVTQCRKCTTRTALTFCLIFQVHNSKEALFSQKGSGISFEHVVLKVKKYVLHHITSQRQTRMVCLDNVRLENLCLKMLIHAYVWLIRKTLRMVFLNCILMMEEFVLHDLRPWCIFRTSSIVFFY